RPRGPRAAGMVAEAGIRSAARLAAQRAARCHARPRLAPELKRYRRVTAVRRNVEPEEESSGGTAVTVALTDDSIGKIVFLRIEATIFLDMCLVAVGGDRHALRRHRDLRRRDVAQL